MPRSGYIPRKQLKIGKGNKMQGNVLKNLLIVAHSATTTDLEKKYGLTHGTAIRIHKKIKSGEIPSVEKLKEMTPKEVLYLYYKRKPSMVYNAELNNFTEKYLYPDIKALYSKYISHTSKTNSKSSSKKTELTVKEFLNREYFNKDNQEQANREKKQLLSLAQVYRLFREYKTQQVTPVFRRHYEVAKNAELDFTGAKAFYKNRETGEIVYVDVLVMVLSYSRKLYVQAIKNQSAKEVCPAVSSCFKAWGGVPETLTIDNFKAAVKRADKFGGEITDYFEQLGRYFNVEIVTARPYKPTDKAICEAHVKVITRTALANLRADMEEGKFCYSLEELNKYLQRFANAINEHKVTGFTHTRNELFKQEQPLLHKVKSWNYSFAEIIKLRVPTTGNLFIYQHQYAVPAKWIGEMVEVELHKDIIKIMHTSLVICQYQRKDGVQGLSTKDHYTKENHVVYEIFNLPQTECLLKWATEIGPNTLQWVQEVLNRKTVSAQKHRLIEAVLSLPRARSNLYPLLDNIIKQLRTKYPVLTAASIRRKWKEAFIQCEKYLIDDYVFNSENYVSLGKGVLTGKFPYMSWDFIAKLQPVPTTKAVIQNQPTSFLHGIKAFK